MGRKKIGERLVERGRLSQADLAAALQEQRGKTILLGDLLIERGAVSRDDMAETLQEILGVEYVDASTVEPDPAALNLIPVASAEQHTALPIIREGRKLTVVMANPQDLHALDQLRFRSGCEISPRIGFRDEIRAGIERCYHKSPAPAAPRKSAPSPKTEKSAPAAQPRAAAVVRSSDELMHEIRAIGTETSDISFETVKMGAAGSTVAAEKEAASANQQTPAVRIFSSLVKTAIQERASDLHIDPHADGAVVRMRVDGMLRDILEVPTDVLASLISRIKILAEMDIAERRAPQDGRVKVKMGGGGQIDLRISTLPTQHGEKAVLRVSNPESARAEFSTLGFSDASAAILRRIMTQPQGMLLVTGPTGSGKTTTLYSVLHQMRTRTRNVITVEDPVEYMLEGVNQVQVNAKAGRTFSSCLRSILRQDPNVIMVGEIRDTETAEIALSASQTGHMVLSTLHTNDSVAAVVRLLDLNIASFLIASSVSAIIAQRLVRKLCVHCRKEAKLAPEYDALLLSAGVNDFGKTMWLPGGCPECDNSGYKGRSALYELLNINEQTRAAIRTNANPDEIRRMARLEGMRLLQEEGLDRARIGVTSLEELFRVLPFDTLPPMVLCQSCGRDVAPSFLFCPNCGTDRRAYKDQPDAKNKKGSIYSEPGVHSGVEA